MSPKIFKADKKCSIILNCHLVASVDLEAVEGLEELHEGLQPAVREVAAAQGEDVDVLGAVWVVL